MAGHLLRCRRLLVVVLIPHIDNHRHAIIHLGVRNVRVQTDRSAPRSHTPRSRLAHHRVPIHQSHLVLVTRTITTTLTIVLLLSPPARHRRHLRHERMHFGRSRIHIARQTAALALSRGHEATAATAIPVAPVVAVMPLLVVMVLSREMGTVMATARHSSSPTAATRSSVVVRLTVPAVVTVSTRDVMTSRIR